jgi:hypothetical protein
MALALADVLGVCSLMEGWNVEMDDDALMAKAVETGAVPAALELLPAPKKAKKKQE